MAGPHFGPVSRKMIRALIASPNGESGFRQNEISQTAVRHGWVKLTYESGRIKWYAITPEGRAFYEDKKG